MTVTEDDPSRVRRPVRPRPDVPLIRLFLDTDDVGWMQDARCRGMNPETFFPERGASTKEAKAVCGGCAVRDACLEYAIREKIHHGIWGQMSERERERQRRARKS